MRNAWIAGMALLLLAGVGVTVLDEPVPPANTSARVSPVAKPGLQVAVDAASAERLEDAAPTIRGRCFDRDSGDPVAHGTVTVDGRTTPLAPNGEFVVLADSGVLVLRSLTHVATRVDLAAWAGGELAVGLRRGVRVSGSLVDAAGDPIQGAVVELTPTGRASVEAGLEELWSTTAEVNGGGAFAWRGLFPPGLGRITVHRAGELASPAVVDLVADAAHLNLKSAGEPLRGHARDGRGRPVVGAMVWADRGAGAIGQDVTDEAGAFQVYVPGGEPVHLRYTPVGGTGGAVGPFGPFRVPTAGIELQAGEVGTVAVRVMDGDTGEPVRAFSFQCVATTGVVRPSQPRTADVDSAGWVRIEVARGPHRLVVHPNGEEWLPTLPVDFDPAVAPTLTVSVKRAVDCPVEVVDESHEPVPDVEVEVLTGTLGSRAPVRDVRRVLSQGQGHGVALRLDDAVTDARGLAILRWTDRHEGALRLRLRGSGVSPVEVGDVILQSGEPIRVVVGRAGAIACRVHGIGRAPFRVVLDGDGGERFPPSWYGAPEGREALEIDSVPAGTWRVRVLTPIEVQGARLGPWGTLAVSEPVQVVPGRTATVEVVAAGGASGEVRGTGFVAGSPAEGVVLRIGEDTGHGVQAVATSVGVPGMDGRFAFRGLQPRLYSVALRVRVGDVRIDVPQTSWRTLAAGESLELELLVAMGSVRLLLDGQSPGRLELTGDGFGVVLPRPVDGVVTLDAVPTGTYRLRRVSRDGVMDLGPLEVTSAGVERRIEGR